MKERWKEKLPGNQSADNFNAGDSVPTGILITSRLLSHRRRHLGQLIIDRGNVSIHRRLDPATSFHFTLIFTPWNHSLVRNHLERGKIIARTVSSRRDMPFRSRFRSLVCSEWIRIRDILFDSSYRAYRRRLSVDFAAIEKFGDLGRLWLQVGPGAQGGRSRNVARIRYVAGGQLSAEREIRPVEPRWPLKLNVSIVI